MIVVTGRVRVSPEHREQFLEVASEMCRRSRGEEGCSGYRVYGDLEQAERYVFVEEWVNDDALQAHFGQPHTAVFMSSLPGLLAEAADVLFHMVASSRPLDPSRGLVPVE